MRLRPILVSALLPLLASVIAALASETGPVPIERQQVVGTWEGISSQYPYAAVMNASPKGGLISLCAGSADACVPRLFTISEIRVDRVGEVVILATDEKGSHEIEFVGIGDRFHEEASIRGILRLKKRGQRPFEVQMSLVQWPDGFLRTAGGLLSRAKMALGHK